MRQLSSFELRQLIIERVELISSDHEEGALVAQRGDHTQAGVAGTLWDAVPEDQLVEPLIQMDRLVIGMVMRRRLRIANEKCHGTEVLRSEFSAVVFTE